MWLEVRKVLGCLLTVVMAMIVYEPRVPFDTDDYWVLVLLEKWNRVARIRRAIRGEKLISHGTYPISVAPARPDINVFRTRLDGVDVRVYDPLDRKSPGPTFIFLHGGGWVKGSPDEWDRFILHLSSSLSSFLFVSVDYRLAPEHPYPAALEDVDLVYRFLLQSHSSYLIDPDRVVIGGDSAGGNLAAAYCLKLRDENAKRHPDDVVPMPKLQVLLYPVLQGLDFRTPSYLGPDPLLNRDQMAAYWAVYLTGDQDGYEDLMENRHLSPERRKFALEVANHELVSQYSSLSTKTTATSDSSATTTTTTMSKFSRLASDPYLSPLVADSLANLPKAYIVACQYDVLRDDAILYARRLSSFSVDVELRVYPRAWHGIMIVAELLRAKKGEEMNREMIQYLRDNV